MLWYEQSAERWEEALPLGNGRLGAMVYGGIARERLQLNDDTVWSGNESNFDRVGAYGHLPEIWRLLFEEKYHEARDMVNEHVLGNRPLGAYQPLGNLILEFSDVEGATEYRRG